MKTGNAHKLQAPTPESAARGPCTRQGSRKVQGGKAKRKIHRCKEDWMLEAMVREDRQVNSRRQGRKLKTMRKMMTMMR